MILVFLGLIVLLCIFFGFLIGDLILEGDFNKQRLDYWDRMERKRKAHGSD